MSQIWKPQGKYNAIHQDNNHTGHIYFLLLLYNVALYPLHNMVEIYHTGTRIHIKAKKCSPILLFASSFLPLFTRNTVYHIPWWYSTILAAENWHNWQFASSNQSTKVSSTNNVYPSWSAVQSSQSTNHHNINYGQQFIKVFHYTILHSIIKTA